MKFTHRTRRLLADLIKKTLTFLASLLLSAAWWGCGLIEAPLLTAPLCDRSSSLPLCNNKTHSCDINSFFRDHEFSINSTLHATCISRLYAWCNSGLHCKNRRSHKSTLRRCLRRSIKYLWMARIVKCYRNMEKKDREREKEGEERERKKIIKYL